MKKVYCDRPPGKMVTGKLKIVDKMKRVPEWLNSPIWSSKSASLVVVSRGHTGEENACGAEREVGMSEPTMSESDRISTQTEKSDVEGTKESDDKTNEGRPLRQSSDLDVPSTPGPSSPGQFSGLNFKRGPSFDSRLDRFLSELSKKVINLAELQLLASEGIPDYEGLRATIWKLFLGYLPRNQDLWERELAKKRSKYAFLKEELLANPSERTRRMEEASTQDKQDSRSNEGGLLRRHNLTHGDHPLSLGETSVWHQFFQYTEITEQIERDVKRTHPDMPFFSGDSASSLENQEAIKHILLIFAKLNPAIQYVQGMNEVLAPLYYVFKTDPDEENAVNAEADAFSCFVELMSNFLDHFCQQLDNSVVGIRSTIAQMIELLRKHDEELWRHLDATTKVNPQFYAFRWITLLLTQDFSFPDCLRIWDSLLSNPYGPLEILLRIGCAMLICIRSRLLAGDFASNLKLLQHYPSVDIDHLLRVADELKTKS